MLSDLLTPSDLLVAASLPKTESTWLTKRLAAHDVQVVTVRKHGGGYRETTRPLDPSLTRFHKRLKEFLDRKGPSPHPCAHGFVRGRSPYTNAQMHLGARAALTVDIADFFPSIGRDRVIHALEEFGANREIAEAIANVGTYKDKLATGFSTSPLLSNLTFHSLDVEFASFARDSDLTYTRYVDDLTFSGPIANDEHLKEVDRILTSAGFQISRKKTRFQRCGHRQVVTGLTIASEDVVRLPRASKRSLRMDLHYSNVTGFAVQAAMRNLDPQEFKDRLSGRINYLMGIELDLGRRLRREFESIPD